ncbi:S-layer homology domain-containing protein [Paenibacillus sp. FSL H8-0537]|uniref:S-layer homology domain-containing protein n=1 Tax=Paenibacillus sp. FSL H8-0537 TaxID=2921399 RepID=UPI0031013F0A
MSARAVIQEFAASSAVKTDNALTRAEAASMLSRVTQLPKPDMADVASVFPDLDKHSSRSDVRKLVALGMIAKNDYPKGFQPDKAVTRFEMMKWMASGLAASDESFKQALADTASTLLPTPETYKGGIADKQIPYIAVIRGAGIIKGMQDGTFRPADPISKAELAAILLRYKRVEGTKADSYQALNELREVGLTGTNLTSITKYKYSRESPYNDDGSYRLEAVAKVGIDLDQHIDARTLEPYLSIPGIGLDYHHYVNGYSKRYKFVKLEELGMSLEEAVADAYESGYSPRLGVEEPGQLSPKDLKLLLSHEDAYINVEQSRMPFTSFANVVDSPIKAKKVATVKLHRMIFVDVPVTGKGEVKGVYANYFADSIASWRKLDNSVYMAFTEMTIQTHAEKMDLMGFYSAIGNGNGNGFFKFSRLAPETMDKNGLTTVPMATSTYFTKDSVRRFWTFGTYLKSNYYPPHLKTDSGAYFRTYYQS